MTKQFFLSFLLLSTHLLWAQEKAPTPEQGQPLSSAQDLQKGGELIKSLGQQLKAKLMHALQTEGPINAVELCSQESQKLAKAISQSNEGWEIRRISLKARSVHAMPDEWEKTALLQLELQNEKKQADDPLIISQSDAQGFRMLKGIKTEAICLTCHGENINGNLASKIKALYPQDQATGYRLNQLRGAFSVKKLPIQHTQP
jgi:hypothetical protein